MCECLDPVRSVAIYNSRMLKFFIHFNRNKMNVNNSADLVDFPPHKNCCTILIMLISDDRGGSHSMTRIHSILRRQKYLISVTAMQ